MSDHLLPSHKGYYLHVFWQGKDWEDGSPRFYEKAYDLTSHRGLLDFLKGFDMGIFYVGGSRDTLSEGGFARYHAALKVLDDHPEALSGAKIKKKTKDVWLNKGYLLHVINLTVGWHWSENAAEIMESTDQEIIDRTRGKYKYFDLVSGDPDINIKLYGFIQRYDRGVFWVGSKTERMIPHFWKKAARELSGYK